DRRDLLKTFDAMRRNADAARDTADMDAYTSRALDIITSPKARDAFDLSKEPEKVRAKYGSKGDKYIYVGTKADSPWEGEKFLLARRLVEAGVPVVTLSAGGRNYHGNVVPSSGRRSS